MSKSFVFLAALLFVGATAVACDFDTDCAVGSKCVKASGDIDGVCAGGMYPGNSNDDSPKFGAESGSMTPISDGTKGKTCSFQADCDPDEQCVKGGNLEGVCM